VKKIFFFENFEGPLLVNKLNMFTESSLRDTKEEK